MEVKQAPIPLTEEELLQLQTGMINAIEGLDKTLKREPSSNILYFKENDGSASVIPSDVSKRYPSSILKTGSYGNGVPNSFSEPNISLKGDQDFNEAEGWELRSKLNEKDCVNENPLFRFVFCDWINIEGQGPEKLANYGGHEKTFFNINEIAKARNDLFYLVINVRIVNMRQSVFIFVCKKEEWESFLKEHLKDPKDCFNGADTNISRLMETLKLCMKVKAKFWTIPTMGMLKNPFMMINTLEPESYNVQLFENRLEVYVDQTGMKFPMFIKPMWNMIVKMTAGPFSNKQCFDIAFLLESGKGDKHGFLFNYPERLLGVVRGDKMEWYCARLI